MVGDSRRAGLGGLTVRPDCGLDSVRLFVLHGAFNDFGV